MKKFLFLHLRFSFVIIGLTVSAILSPIITKAQADTVCSANWWAICCKCKTNCLIVKPLPAFGYCRECNLLCPDCNRKLGNLNDALEKLKGRNRGLKEAYDAHEESYAKASQKYDATREKIYGNESGEWTASGLTGSLGKFSGAAFGVLSNTTGATNAFKTVSNAVSIYQTSGTSDAMMNGTGTVIDLFTSSGYIKNILVDEIFKNDVDKMYRQMRNGTSVDQVMKNFNHDLVPNTPYNLDEVMKGADFAGFLMDVYGYYSATKELFNDISHIQDYLFRMNAAMKEMKKISDSIVKNVELMICIRETLDSLNSGGLGSRSSKEFSNMYAVNMIIPASSSALFSKYFSLAIENPLHISLYDTSWQMDEIKITSAFNQLKKLNGLLTIMMKRINKEILPPLIPWITNRREELKPAVLLQLLQRAKKSISVLITDLGKAKDLTQPIIENIETATNGYEINYLSDISNTSATGAHVEKGSGGTDKWTIKSNTKIKGELGRVNMNFPRGVEWSIDFSTTENKFITNRSSYSKHQPFYDVVPGNYNLTLNHITIENVSVEKGKETKLKTGFLHIISTRPWEIYSESKEKYYTSGNKPVKMALPAGRYLLNFEGKDYRVMIGEGAYVKFEIPVTSVLNKIK